MLRIPIWIIVVLVVGVPSVMWAADVVLPRVFVAGTTIRASEVNENFGPLWAEHSTGARFSIVGGSHSTTYGEMPVFSTALEHVLLNGNPAAYVLVSPIDFQGLVSCAQTQANSLYFDPTPEYTGGRWWVRFTCPGVSYRVVVFSGAR